MWRSEGVPSFTEGTESCCSVPLRCKKIANKITALLRHYDDTFMPSGVFGRAAYVQRNLYMIDNADVCLFYCDCSVKDCAVGKSGARIAYEYAAKRRKEIVNLWHSRQR